MIDIKKLSPMMKHYLEKKQEYSDCLLFYRLGDFYEMFFEDAITISNCLNLTLTGRDCGLEEKAPMCGVPHHAGAGYIAKLVKLGFKVAICEQLTAPTPGKIVERDVVKVITSGTNFDENYLEENKNNFIASLTKEKEINIAYVDITTGEFFIGTPKDVKELNDLLTKVKPAEIFCDFDPSKLNEELSCIKLLEVPKIEMITKYTLNFNEEEDLVKKHFKNDDINSNKLIHTLAMLLFYINRTQKTELNNLKEIKFVSSSNYLNLDSNSRRNLEIIENNFDRGLKGTLLSVLDKTETAMGGRLIKNWLNFPLLNKNEIENRFNGVDEIRNGGEILLSNLSDILKRIKDIERIAGRLASSNFTPRDAIALSDTLKQLPKLTGALSSSKSEIIVDCLTNIGDFSSIVKLIDDSIIEMPPNNLKDGGYIKTNFNKELKEKRDISSNGKELIAKMEQYEKEKTGASTLKIGFNNIFGYYIEIKEKEKNLAPYNYTRKQTIAGGERYITDELKALESKILSASEDAIKLEAIIFIEIKNKLTSFISEFLKAGKAIACLDVLFSFARVSLENKYIRPNLNTKGVFEVVDGRHPVVEKFLGKNEFTPNDCNLNNETKTILLTGPNMGGKSTYMRQVALISIMAQVGCFIPASSANICIFDKIFTRIGASDDLAFGRSTFMVEMLEVASILENASKDSLIILDEVGRGTATFDGLSIAYSVLNYISTKLSSKTLFATHYHELINLENSLKGLKNFSVSVKELNGNILFLHKIVRGGASRSYGIEVAKLAGLPKEVLTHAKTFLEYLENSDAKISLIEGTMKDNKKPQSEVVKNNNLTEIGRILNEININNLSPLEAFDIILRLKEKIND